MLIISFPPLIYNRLSYQIHLSNYNIISNGYVRKTCQSVIKFIARNYKLSPAGLLAVNCLTVFVCLFV